ncbi:MAG: type II toxin-antitoxin system Phd/YefM family antitoxin [Rhodobacteraceae bacterium]|nr:type II toxin-antitoxin system Phd/YefM family antitoxin [Paracoccaceae bacterium]
MANLQKLPDPELTVRANMGQVRRHLALLIARVEHHGTKIILRRHGKPVAAIVSMDDFHRIWEIEDEEILGPRDPDTGRRMGAQWVRETGWKPEGRTVIAEVPKDRHWWMRLRIGKSPKQ